MYSCYNQRAIRMIVRRTEWKKERKKKCCAKHSLNLCICILLPSTHQKVSDDNKRKAKKNSTEKSERTECNVYKIKIIYRRSYSTQLNSILFDELQPQIKHIRKYDEKFYNQQISDYFKFYVKNEIFNRPIVVSRTCLFIEYFEDWIVCSREKEREIPFSIWMLRMSICKFGLFYIQQCQSIFYQRNDIFLHCSWANTLKMMADFWIESKQKWPQTVHWMFCYLLAYVMATNK